MSFFSPTKVIQFFTRRKGYAIRQPGSISVEALVNGFPQRLEVSLTHRRELNHLIRHEATTLDEVRTKLLAMPNLNRKSWGHKCESPLVAAVAASRPDLVDLMVRECGVDINSYDKKILSGHVTRPTTALLYAISCYDTSPGVSIPMIKLLIRLNADVRIEGWSFLFRDRWTYGSAFDVASSKPGLVKLLQQSASAKQMYRVRSNRKSNEEVASIFDLRCKDIQLMASHLRETEDIMAKTKNKISEVATIKTWLCKERDRPGGSLSEPDVETFLEGLEKVEAHINDLKRTESRSFRLTQYKKKSTESSFAPIKAHLECCICMDVPKGGDSIYSCQSDHLICNVCLKQVEVNVCPVCKEEFDGKNLSRNILAERILEVLAPLQNNSKQKLP